MIYINLPIYIKKSFFIIKERLEIGKNDDLFLFILNYKFPVGKKVVNLGWYINCLIPSWICLLRTLYELTCQNCLSPALLPCNLRVYCPYALEAQVAVRTHELLAADRGWRTPWK